MKAKILKDWINGLDDDFDVTIFGTKRIPGEVLKTMSYPYPNDLIEFEPEIGDTSYSEKVSRLDINLDKPL
jgi:hypothetical protein